MTYAKAPPERERRTHRLDQVGAGIALPAMTAARSPPPSLATAAPNQVCAGIARANQVAGQRCAGRRA
jgi:hypothetical protein